MFGLHRDDDSPVDAAPDVVDLMIVDRDGDGIDDSLDTCIVSPADDATDDDGDGDPNATDPCPFNGSPSGDADGDGILDSCDPFTSTPGDHHLCVMSFVEPQLASLLWLPRASPEISWSANPGLLRAIPAGNDIATVIAATSLEGANVTTYQGVFTFTTHGKSGGITLWLRADPTTSTIADVGCHLESTTTGGPGTVGVTTPGGFKDQKPLAFTPGTANGLRIQGSLATLGANVLATCRFTINSSPVLTSTAMVPLVPGRVGFTTDRWDTTITSLYVTDRP